MAFIESDGSGITANRVFLIGPPNSGKTESMMTWPTPAYYAAMPGEHGHATITKIPPRILKERQIFPHYWQDEEVSKDSGAVITQVESLIFGLLAKHKEYRSLLIDGFHKYYDLVLDWESGGDHFAGREIGTGGNEWASARIHNRTRMRAMHFLKQVMSSPVEYIAITFWDDKEADDPGKKNSPTHRMPDLPGKSAKRVMGETAIAVYSTINWAMMLPGGRREAYWQLVPEGDVWGAAVKVPLDVLTKLPTKIKPALPELERVLSEAYAKAYPTASSVM